MIPFDFVSSLSPSDAVLKLSAPFPCICNVVCLPDNEGCTPDTSTIPIFSFMFLPCALESSDYMPDISLLFKVNSCVFSNMSSCSTISAIAPSTVT